MRGWDRAGVRTERIIVDGCAFDAPLVVMRSGEILPLILRFPEAGVGQSSAASATRKRCDAAEAIIDSVHLTLTVGSACKRTWIEKAADEILKPALELIADAVRLYRASRSGDEVQRLCVLITRQVRMGLMAFRLRRAVFRALKADNPNVLYRKFTRAPKTDENGRVLKDKYGRIQFVTGLTKQYRRGKSRRPPQGHIYEVIQCAATVGMPALHLDQETGMPDGMEAMGAVEFLPPGQSTEAFDDLCRGHLPEEDVPSGVVDRGMYAYYGDEPHICCVLPSMLPPSPPCCETELHNLFITRWEPWGIEEDSAFVASAILFRDGVLMCERMLCYGLNRRAYGQAGEQSLPQE